MNEIRLYGYELASMPNYSTTIPSGTVLYKMWRRDNNQGRRFQIMEARCPSTMEREECAERRRALLKECEGEDWYVGQYLPSDIPEQVLIRWYKVVLKHGPQPRRWQPPDWHNQARYNRSKYA